MPSTHHRVLYATIASLVVLASSVEAKGKGGTSSSQKTKKPIVTGGGGGNNCYDDDGNQITCPLSKTELIIIGVIAGVVVLFVITLVLCCVVRKRRLQEFAPRKKDRKKDTKGAHEKIPTEEVTEEATAPLSPHEPSADLEKAGGMVETEKPYDPVYPKQHYDHQYSDSASIASSVYHAPPLTYSQPQDYSYQHYYHTGATAQPGSDDDTPLAPSHH